jgi:hypothetical protein
MYMNQWHRRVCSQTEASICACVKWNGVGWWNVCYSQIILCCAACYPYLKHLQRWYFKFIFVYLVLLLTKGKNWFHYNSGLKKFTQEWMSIYTWESIIKQRRCYGFSQHGHVTITNSFHNVRDVSYKRTNVIYMSIYTQTITGLHIILHKKLF